MTQYFCAEESILFKGESSISKVMRNITNRYIGDNPAYHFTLRAFSKNGFRQGKDGRYELDLNSKYPAAKLGQYVYLFSMLWSDEDCEIGTSISFNSPSSLVVNGKLLHRSLIHEERYSEAQKILTIQLQKGWNSFQIKTQKSPTGFGCTFGSTSSKWCPIHFMSPFIERYGQGGWIYSELLDGDTSQEIMVFDIKTPETSTGLKWYPALEWNEEDKNKPVLSRIFAESQGKVAYGWSRLSIKECQRKSYTIVGKTKGPVKIWSNNNEVFSKQNPGDINFTLTLGHGEYDILVESVRGTEDWGYTLSVAEEEKKSSFQQPCPVKGIRDEWIYLGPFDAPLNLCPIEITDIYRLFGDKEKSVYWRLDKPGFQVRPYLENKLFGKWNYHLGVTLYGLLRTAKLLDRNDVKNYVFSHIHECIRMYEYSLYDREQYGYQSINHQLVEMDALDDCGSFGAATIELYNETGDKTLLPVIEIIADYISNGQIRREDMAFCRGDDTMWVDDLYMGTPFLAKYYKLTGKQNFIDDAASQFLLFKKYLYMPEYRIMSHVYDCKHNTPTYVPWGRGNGWVLFSLSEVLEILPADHKDRDHLIMFFKELCEGYVKLQGKNGLWHQILTDPESYEETSCTAMFTYAFARGVRFGWLSDIDLYANAVYKAWQGLTGISVDYYGNVHGVCRGSNFSYSQQYYKYDLLWVKNDTHGTGIVLLAGDEARKMEKWLNQK